MSDGATKYGPYNWRQTKVRTSVYIGAIKRHLAAYIDGEDRTLDTDVRHMGAVAACAGILMDAAEGGFLVDDRPAKGPASKMLAQQDRSTPGHQAVPLLVGMDTPSSEVTSPVPVVTGNEL